MASGDFCKITAPLLKVVNPIGYGDAIAAGKWYDFETGKGYNGPVMLKDFEVGLDKTPCFIGGKGIIIQRKSKTIIA